MVTRSSGKGARRRGGIRRKGNGFQAYVRLHHGAGGLATRHFPIDTPRSDMQAWIEDAVTDYRRRAPRGQPGTLAADVPRYLKLLVDRPRLQAERAGQLTWWCARFGARARWSLRPVELETALNELLASGRSVSSVRHFRTALYHLYTKLDGKNAPNPLRDVPPPREADPRPRAIPYAIIDQIFDAMPDKGQGLRHQKRTKLSKTKARLGLMAYVGLPPAQIKALELADINFEDPSVLVVGRNKGGGTRAVRLPVTPRGVAALRAFVAAEAWGPYSPSSARMSFLRAVKRVCGQLGPAGETVRQALAGVRPYDLRHSLLTEAQLATGNPEATRALAQHADIRQTSRYTLAAVAPQLKAAVALLAETPAGRATFQATNDDGKGPKLRGNAEKSKSTDRTDRAAKSGAKPRVSSKK